MANQLVYQDEVDSSLWAYGAGGDHFRLVVNTANFSTIYPIKTMFPVLSGQGILQPGLVGDGIFIDTTYQQAYLVRNGTLKVIAGIWGTCGYRDGLGSQALLGAGGLQEITYGIARASTGVWYFADARNSKIRTLTDNGNGTWSVGTFLNYYTNGLAIDADDNLWVSNGTFLTKIAPNTTQTNYSIPDGNVIQIAPDGQYLYLMTRNSSWDVIDRFDRTTGLTTRIAGMTQDEIDAYVALHGVQLVDGPAINGATFHSTGMFAITNGGAQIYTDGGDEHQVRKIEGGQVTSLLGNGTYAASQLRVQSQGGNLSEPFFVVQGAGLQNTGLPWSAPFNFINQGGRTWFQKVVSVPIGPSSGNDSAYVSGGAPVSMVAGQSYPVTVSMQNTGTTTWTRAGGYNLGVNLPTRDSTVFGVNRLYLNAGDSIAPGATGTYSGTLVAPAAGSYLLQFQTVQDGIQWYGSTGPIQTITVTGVPSSGGIAPITFKFA